MIDFDEIKAISNKNEGKIVLLVMDGLGGIPDPQTHKTELETAYTPNLDRLAQQSICGLADPVNPGIIPGSGPGHLAIFGYDPLKYKVGRGVLEALGIDFDLNKDDIAARGNFCTLNTDGQIVDRRAGRISTEKCKELCDVLQTIKLEKAEIAIRPVREHRFLFVLRNNTFSPEIDDTDPQRTDAAPLNARARTKKAEPAARVINKFIQEARHKLKDQHPANMILLRGFSRLPLMPSMSEIYKLKPAAIATYPMYRGLAKLAGMHILQPPADLDGAIKLLSENFGSYDFFFVHFKDTDRLGEDGNFKSKVEAIEKVDKIIPQITRLNPDVLIVTADHSTPAVMKGHSWHSVPFMLYSKWCRPDAVERFSESGCLAGGLGIFPSVNIMQLAMANALKFSKFGA